MFNRVHNDIVAVLLIYLYGLEKAAIFINSGLKTSIQKSRLTHNKVAWPKIQSIIKIQKRLMA